MPLLMDRYSKELRPFQESIAIGWVDNDMALGDFMNSGPH